MCVYEYSAKGVLSLSRAEDVRVEQESLPINELLATVLLRVKNEQYYGSHTEIAVLNYLRPSRLRLKQTIIIQIDGRDLMSPRGWHLA
jgi:hypothetical protein